MNVKIKKKQRERQEERGRKIEGKKERRDEVKVEQFVVFSENETSGIDFQMVHASKALLSAE